MTTIFDLSHYLCPTVINILIILKNADIRITGEGAEADEGDEQLEEDHPGDLEPDDD